MGQTIPFVAIDRTSEYINGHLGQVNTASGNTASVNTASGRRDDRASRSVNKTDFITAGAVGTGPTESKGSRRRFRSVGGPGPALIKLATGARWVEQLPVLPRRSRYLIRRLNSKKTKN